MATGPRPSRRTDEHRLSATGGGGRVGGVRRTAAREVSADDAEPTFPRHIGTDAPTPVPFLAFGQPVSENGAARH